MHSLWHSHHPKSTHCLSFCSDIYNRPLPHADHLLLRKKKTRLFKYAANKKKKTAQRENRVEGKSKPVCVTGGGGVCEENVTEGKGLSKLLILILSVVVKSLLVKHTYSIWLYYSSIRTYYCLGCSSLVRKYFLVLKALAWVCSSCRWAPMSGAWAGSDLYIHELQILKMEWSHSYIQIISRQWRDFLH